MKRLAAARSERRHLYLEDWRFAWETEPAHAVEAVLAWCRDTLACCPRPFGIDHFDLAVAVRDTGRASATSLSFLKLRTYALYEPALAADLTRIIDRGPAPGASESGDLFVSAALFSWGAAAHQSLPVRL